MMQLTRVRIESAYFKRGKRGTGSRHVRLVSTHRYLITTSDIGSMTDLCIASPSRQLQAGIVRIARLDDIPEAAPYICEEGDILWQVSSQMRLLFLAPPEISRIR